MVYSTRKRVIRDIDAGVRRVGECKMNIHSFCAYSAAVTPASPPEMAAICEKFSAADDINIAGMNMNVKIVNIISLIPLTNLKIRIIICA